MDVFGFIGGVVGGTFGSSAVVLLLANVFKERWIERVKANYAAELESVRDQIQRDQKTLQARLDQGVYVTKAQYDLELTAYKDLWVAVSELRNSIRAIAGIDFHSIPGTPNDWRLRASSRAASAYIGAHNAAVIVTERMAPFYEKTIQESSRSTTFASNLLLQDIAVLGVEASEDAQQQVSRRIVDICEGIEKMDMLIRQRLGSLRLL